MREINGVWFWGWLVGILSDDKRNKGYIPLSNLATLNIELSYRVTYSKF